MIVNKQILELMGTCGESLTHFVQLLGSGDESFQMSLDDAVRYLEVIEAENPSVFAGWTNFVKSFSSNPKYIKYVSTYTYGEYVVLDQPNITYTSLEAVKAAQNDLQNVKIEAGKSDFSEWLYISAVRCCSGGETLTTTQFAVDGCTYAVFNPLDGNHYKVNTFEAAQEKLEAISRAFLSTRYPVRIGRQIVVDGAVVAVDILEDE